MSTKKAKKSAKKPSKKAAALKPNGGAPRVTYRDKLLAMFRKKDALTLDEIAAKSGTTKSNISVAIGILKNPKRTKPDRLLVIERGEDRLYRITKGGAA